MRRQGLTPREGKLAGSQIGLGKLHEAFDLHREKAAAVSASCATQLHCKFLSKHWLRWAAPAFGQSMERPMGALGCILSQNGQHGHPTGPRVRVLGSSG